MNDITLGASTWLWTSPFNTASIPLLYKIRDMGFGAVEIPVEYPELIDAGAVRRALEETGLKAIVCGAFGPARDLTHPDAAIRAGSTAYMRQCLELCAAWNAPVFAGPMYSAVGKARQLPEAERKAEWELAVKGLREVCAIAEQQGVRLAIEPLNRFESDLVNTAADARRMAEELDHPSAGVGLDSFHMSIEEKDPGEAIRTAGDWLVHVQVSENHRGIPGTGQTPWNSLRDAIREVGYKGVVSIESFTPDVVELAGAVCIWKQLAPDQDTFGREGIRFLQQLFKS
ncbi:sugar phosphate isomerase/epimerase [Chitinophaga sp.]|uniref:sugar phosphate isomerase/epimerase family protein n=1 Tax=Chitinophaga sp. TaxID=1869181 RepID=UPI002607189E|nr:sugar phosphate isomerase/epimerase family protein [uncultured Chitinophaga sp.]